MFIPYNFVYKHKLNLQIIVGKFNHLTNYNCNTV